MPNQNNPKMNIRKDTITKITDSNGEIIAAIGLHEYTIKHSDGSLTHSRENETIILECGTVWSPSMLLSKPPVHVVICQQCRQGVFGRGSHGLVSRKMAKRCEKGGCGQFCCPKHARKDREGKWFCLSHYGTASLKSFLRPFFFEKEE